MGDTHTKKTIGKRVASNCSKTTVVVREGVTSHSGFFKKMSKSQRTIFWIIIESSEMRGRGGYVERILHILALPLCI